MRPAVPHARRALALAGTVLGLAGAAACPLSAQGATPPAGVRAVSLDEALRLAESRSENVRIARSGVLRARGQQLQARSQYLPQLYGSVQYTRTLASQFEALRQPAAAPDTRPFCAPFTPPPPSDPIAARVDSIERALALATNCQPRATDGGLPDFSKVGFGAKNQYTLGLQGSLNLFTGGRVTGQNVAANAGRRAAEVGLASAHAQIKLDATEAYFDAVLADRLLVIAESTYVQAENTYRQTALARNVGTQSEFQLLQAQVTRDNQRPVVIQRRTQRDLALLRLKQLLELPLGDSLRLTTDIIDSTMAVPVLTAATAPAASVVPAGGAGAVAAALAAADTSVERRAPVRQAAENVRAQEALLRVTRAQRLPSVTLSSQYGRLAYPSSGLPQWSDFTNNWTVSVGLQVPLFTGGRITGEEMVARASVEQARDQYQQVRELAALDAQSALDALREAEATWLASQGTTVQASRAYTIAEVRYREGISTQLELSQSRLLLEQAQANRAYAARNLQVARVRLALLADLPLGTTGAGQGTAGGAGDAAQQQQQQLQQQQQRQAPAQQASASFTGTGSTGGTTP